MKIHVYLLCYNEELIIKNVIDYYSSFCSKIFIMDNMSTDNSCKIAQSNPKVTIIPWENDGYIDESLYVKIKSQTYKNHSRKDGEFTTEIADWVISCDMDEILYHPELLHVLSEYKKMGVTVPCITGLNIVGKKDIDKNVNILSQYNKAVRSAGFDKRIVFDTNFNISYSDGCHPQGPGFEYMKKTYSYKSSNQYPIALLHYKHIGQRFYEAGIKNSKRVNPNNISKDKDGNYTGVGWQYKAIESGDMDTLGEEFAHQLFDENFNVLFNNFPPSTCEKGSNKQNKSVALTANEIDFLRDLSVKLEAETIKYRKDRITLLELALKFRPTGLFIKNRLNKYYEDDI
jgi:hypothetical protein